MRLAFFTPISPVQSALADFGEGLALALAALPNVVQLDLYIGDDYEPNNEVVREKLTIYPHRAYPGRHTEYDVTLYSLGDNGRFHAYMLDYLHRYPGVVILNDLTLHRCILWATVGQNKPQEYIEELAYAYDTDAAHVATHISSDLGNEVLLQYPLFERIVDSSLGVIVQNEFARRKIVEKRPSVAIETIPYPYFLPPGFPATEPQTLRAQQRASLNLNSDAFVVGSFGIFVPNKQLNACLTAFQQIAQELPQAHYLLAGFPADGYDLSQKINAMNLSEQVTITGWLPPPDFVQQMFALDVGIHLRHPHIGGTPYTPIRLMGLGITTITSDIEPLATLPQGSCIKIAPDDYAEATLSLMLQTLAHNDTFRQSIGENGRQFIERHFALEKIALRYVDFLQNHQ